MKNDRRGVESEGSPFLYRDRMEKIIPYLFHTSICTFTTGAGLRAKNGDPGCFPEKGDEGLIFLNYLNFYAFFN
jgi:hypothetical protein